VKHPITDAKHDEESRRERPSKSARKREMHCLQKLGESLVALPETYLKTSGLPEELLEAVLKARKIRSFGARRRQMQYIGVLMRGVDADDVRRVLDLFHAGR